MEMHIYYGDYKAAATNWPPKLPVLMLSTGQSWILLPKVIESRQANREKVKV